MEKGEERGSDGNHCQLQRLAKLIDNFVSNLIGAFDYTVTERVFGQSALKFFLLEPLVRLSQTPSRAI